MESFPKPPRRDRRTIARATVAKANRRVQSRATFVLKPDGLLGVTTKRASRLPRDGFYLSRRSGGQIGGSVHRQPARELRVEIASGAPVRATS